jgi:hypothetical protein
VYLENISTPICKRDPNFYLNLKIHRVQSE